jgi:hypothetical protein
MNNGLILVEGRVKGKKKFVTIMVVTVSDDNEFAELQQYLLLAKYKNIDVRLSVV